MSTAITASQSDIVEQVIIKGDLSALTPTERVNYYRAVCESVGLNPLTMPFGYINLKGKLTLYAKKDATDQLRKLNSVSIGKPDISFQDDLIIVAVSARNADGREDSDIGVVRKGDMGGDAANALMKAVTKAKRRVTLSLCGLGWLDETEVETIPDAKHVTVTPDGGLGPQWTDEKPYIKVSTGPNGERVETLEWTHDAAAAIKTFKGNSLGTLSADQLLTLTENSTRQEIKSAAQFLLAELEIGAQKALEEMKQKEDVTA